MPKPDPLHRNRHKPGLGGRGAAWLLILAATGASLAGCLAVDTDTRSEQQGDETAIARLERDRDGRWTQEAFTLDARGSDIGAMNLTTWRLEPGDGTVHEGEDLSQAVVHHAFGQAGVFEARLTLTGTSPAGENVSTAATKTLVVNERSAIEQETLYAAPVEDAPTARSVHAFDLHENATAWEADLRLENPGVFPQSNITIRVHDADNETLYEKNITLDANTDRTLRMTGDSTGPGTYTMEIRVETGSVESTGESRVYYAPPEEAL